MPDEADRAGATQKTVGDLQSDGVLAFDGQHSPALFLDQLAEWVCGLGDGLLVRDSKAAWLYEERKLTSLDAIIEA